MLRPEAHRGSRTRSCWPPHLKELRSEGTYGFRGFWGTGVEGLKNDLTSFIQEDKGFVGPAPVTAFDCPIPFLKNGLPAKKHLLTHHFWGSGLPTRIPPNTLQNPTRNTLQVAPPLPYLSLLFGQAAPEARGELARRVVCRLRFA